MKTIVSFLFSASVARRALLGVASTVCGVLAFTGSAQAQQVGDAFIVYNVSTGELRVNPGNAGVTEGNGIVSYAIRPDPDVISFSSTASDFSYLSGAYPLFPPTLGNVTAGSDNTIGAAFYTLGSPNVNTSIGYFNHNNMVLDTAAVAGSGGSSGTTWGPGAGGVVASEIAGDYFGTPEWSFGTIGSTGMSLEEALTAFGATTQGGLSASSNLVYGINGVVGTQNFMVYTVPEPSTVALLAVCGGLGALVWVRRRRAVA
jgi:hypothetical protein